MVFHVIAIIKNLWNTLWRTFHGANLLEVKSATMNEESKKRAMENKGEKEEKLASSFSFFPHPFQISKNGSHPIPKIGK